MHDTIVVWGGGNMINDANVLFIRDSTVNICFKKLEWLTSIYRVVQKKVYDVI